MKTLRTILLTAVYLGLLVVAAPGLSFLKPSLLSSESSRARFERRFGQPAAVAARAATEINRLRRPAAAAIGGFQPVFRVRQSWHLYRDGPSTIRRLEIWVDDARVYRTGDATLNWSEAVLRNRRIRPIAETLVKKPNAKNRLGLARYVVAMARQDFPEAESIELRSVWGDRAGEESVHHAIRASAPTWSLEDRR